MCRLISVSLAIALPLLCLAAAARADDGSGVFTGTLGNSPIVLRLYRNDDNAVVGTYFYRSHGVDIGLVAEGDPGQFVECSLPGGNNDPSLCDNPTGYWRLSSSAATLTGFWRKTRDATASLPIKLARVEGSDTSAASGIYARLRADGPREVLAAKGASEDGAVAWQFLREKRSEATIPQLTKAPDPAAMRAINQDLDRHFLEDIDQALAAKPEGEASCEYRVPFANLRFFVVDSECAWDSPGAPHPSNAWISVSYDLATGKAIDWTKVFHYPDKAGSLDFAQGSDIVSLALRHAAKSGGDCMHEALESFGCNDTVCRRSDWKGALSLSPRKNGLFAAFDGYAEIQRACRGEGVTLPWDEVRALLLAPRPLP